MRTDEIAPRISLSDADDVQRKKWVVFNPAFRGLLSAFIAGLYADSAFHAYQAGMGFDVRLRVFTATLWFGMAAVGVVRGLRKAR